MRKFLLTGAFFFTAPTLLLISALFLLQVSYQDAGRNGVLGNKNSSVAFAALPSADMSLKDHIDARDARAENLRAFFLKNKSPLEPHSEDFINAAEKYELDYRLLPAIAMQESNLCKKAPKDSYNCWGFGVYGKKVIKFPNFEEAIESVSKTLSENYKSIGLVTPEQIMSKYTPSNQGDWAESVNYFMGQL